MKHGCFAQLPLTFKNSTPSPLPTLFRKHDHPCGLRGSLRAWGGAWALPLACLMCHPITSGTCSRTKPYKQGEFCLSLHDQSTSEISAGLAAERTEKLSLYWAWGCQREREIYREVRNSAISCSLFSASISQALSLPGWVSAVLGIWQVETQQNQGIGWGKGPREGLALLVFLSPLRALEPLSPLSIP